ncbi:MAG: uracil-DNA glycosylase [Planctomycetia bacterium]|nr:uracil-DNA glycosylase [Planctomycetia bacterium]
MSFAALRAHQARVIACESCPRLRRHCRAVAADPPRRHAGDVYWARPVPGFGDPGARIVLVGLAPGAHGSNRTGRMFTGDASGDFLYPALHRAGLASQPRATSRDDGLTLRGCWITAAARCAPPGNKPAPAELERCRAWLERELALLPDVRVLLAIGRIGHDAVLRIWGERLTRWPFAHGAVHRVPGRPALVDSYHVSRQNTNTGKLTAEMFDGVVARAVELAGPETTPPSRSPRASSGSSRAASRPRTT